MRDTESEEGSHDIVKILAVTTIELADGQEDECERHVLEEVALAAD